MPETTDFILAGNGSYENRGCEAIVRGTVNILSKVYAGLNFKVFSFFRSKSEYHKQIKNETDPSVEHYQLGFSRFDAIWWERQFKKISKPSAVGQVAYKELAGKLQNCRAAFSVGGDNYSLEGEVSEMYTEMDKAVISSGKPQIIWGASVGPFSKNLKYEKFMSSHLKRITAIFARETSTVAYLDSIGVRDNVYLTADPAFLMDPVKPCNGFVPQTGSIGVNLSPLIARYSCGGSMTAWVRLAAALIKEVSIKSKRKIYLIPHETRLHTNDHKFLCQAKSLLPENLNVEIIPDTYSAAELKSIISALDMFAGARTHSTIAALSTNVPTLSLAYSMKAKGINNDIFGHSDFCLDSSNLSVNEFVDKVLEILTRKDEIRNLLANKIPLVKQLALSAGNIVKGILG